MPNPLPEPYERVTWRVSSTDLETLRLLFPGRVNEIVRELLSVYCGRIRSGLKGAENQGASSGPNAA